jgi:FtsP/CotA-like multicopper oxidase with cupredoxin domain
VDHAGGQIGVTPDGRGVVGDQAVAANYGHGIAPPLTAPATLLDAVTYPPAPDGRPAGQLREHTLDVVETSLEVADGVRYDAWTYGGRAPGPILRATEGDTLRLTVRNRTDRPHNLHLHGRHSPQMDGWEPIPPGAQFTYEVVAAPFGVHPYHCHTPPLAMHVAKGLYGAFIVDPPDGRPPAHEVVLLLSGWDLDSDGTNELVVWNGVAGWYQRHPITVPVGELVRVYVLNMTEHEPVASFHLHAQTFDVFWHGTSLTPDIHADTIALTQGDRAIVEFTLPERGRYMFHPHQHRLADMGAMGWFAAV